MLRKMLQKDFLRKNVVTVVVFFFILLAALLVASGTNLIVELARSLDAFFAAARAPHFVQMHAGDLDEAEIAQWAAENPLVAAHQTMEMITVDGSTLYLGDSGQAEENSVMDISFVRQNSDFDFLLDLNNEVIRLAPGEIGVPIYFAQQGKVEVGDTVILRSGREEMAFTVATLVRDAQMNPSIVHSKRFLVHASDYAVLQDQYDEVEYLVEFRLTDPGRVGEFTQAYQAAGLPSRGPTLDHRILRLFNGISDGIVAGVVIVLSLVLIIIAILCLRFTILATMEEDYKEIGVMKAIGINKRDIRRLYLAKYVVMAALAAVLGYAGSLFLNRALATNILLYSGRAPRTLLHHAVPVAAAGLIFLIVLLSCALVLRRFNRISAVEALRSGSIGDSLNVDRLHLKRSKRLDVNIFLGLRDLFQRGRLFGLIYLVFFFCVAIMIIPIHFLTTIQSPSFISYMGIGRSDIRIDLRQTDDVARRFEQMTAALAADEDVAQFSPLVTAQFSLLQENGRQETINVETGDFTIFPLDYVAGTAPTGPNEIALSILNAQDMEKEVGDTLVLLVDGREREMVVSGIYQDVTNGGRTAKAMLPYQPENAVWYNVSLDLKSSAAIEEKVSEYAAAFDPARVTDLDGYIQQTLGNTITQLRRVTAVAIGVGLAVSVLITSLFLNMLITKDAAEIAIMRSLGFSLRDIRAQYLTRALLLLGVGIVLGTLFSNTIGQRLVSVLWSFMGASQIRFVIDPLQSYLLFPLLLAAVAVTTLFSIAGIKESSIATMMME